MGAADSGREQADLNADVRPDVAATNLESNSVSVLLGQ
jgi:hypothetical protein